MERGTGRGTRRRSADSDERFWDDAMEKEFEERIGERIEAQKRRLGDKTKLRGKNAGKDAARNKAPLLLRLLSWCGVVLFCFVMGYLGANYMLKFLGGQPLFKPAGLNPSSQELEIFLSADQTAEGLRDIQKKTLSLFYPKEGVLTEEKTEIIAGTFEDDIRDVVRRLAERSGLFGGSDGGVHVTHVFRDVDLVYLDFSGPFAAALSAAGEKTSTLFITGIVRTMRDGFSIVKVRFLLDSKVSSDGAPVNLTATWQMPQ
jgi:hypothetical protein